MKDLQLKFNRDLILERLKFFFDDISQKLFVFHKNIYTNYSKNTPYHVNTFDLQIQLYILPAYKNIVLLHSILCCHKYTVLWYENKIQRYYFYFQFTTLKHCQVKIVYSISLLNLLCFILRLLIALRSTWLYSIWILTIFSTALLCKRFFNYTKMNPSHKDVVSKCFWIITSLFLTIFPMLAQKLTCVWFK